ncbi:cytidylate kinase-like family protein [Oscillibacter sp.]|uniref:cytidylate kinase-like family protein n=1 Tax=Oscillibacter sp. TaxID=1945593 RepID=UPI002897E29E|nr:cytidylate kinase-like family protein [Oscillibacter sp.]
MSQNRIITIGRQLGSGGREIGKQLSEKLGIGYYDREIIQKAALESGITEEIMESYDEKAGMSFLYSLVMNSTLYAGNDTKPLELRAYLAQVNAVKRIVDSGSCVIVGRGADYILRDYPNLVKVFVVADIDYRIQHVMERRNVSADKAQILIQRTDKSRASFYNYHTEQKWSDVRNYDLCINSAKTSLSGAIKIIECFISNNKR